MAKPNAKPRRARETTATYPAKRARIIHPYIEMHQREPRVRGSEISVRAIVEAWRGGSSLDALVLQFAPLRLAQICDALGYYDDHRAEIGLPPASTKAAFVEDPEVTRQRRLNNEAFRKMQAELEAKYWGKWVCIAEGKLQAVANDWMDFRDVAQNAKHRVVTQVGAPPRRPIRLPFRVHVGTFSK